MLKSVLKFLLDIFELQKLHQKVLWRSCYLIHMLIHACSPVQENLKEHNQKVKAFILFEPNQNDNQLSNRLQEACLLMLSSQIIAI